MIRIGILGLGKMGLSHLAMIHAHPSVEVVAVVDSSSFVLDVLGKYTGLDTYTDFNKMLAQSKLDAVIISTPTRFHKEMVAAALEAGLHIFCEKPLCLNAEDSKEVARIADSMGLVSQVGYHNRFVGAFSEVKRLLERRTIGHVTHVLAEAYGPVVLQEKNSTWRSRRSEGGGCLYDYAAHPIDLVTWYLGTPIAASGTILNRVFSRETEDEVFSTLQFENDSSAHVSVSWSDESSRKMTTKLTLWGTAGRIYVDRQECQVYLRDNSAPPVGYQRGWNVRYTTELTEPVWFYLRGEEYSAQLDHFVGQINGEDRRSVNTFQTAATTDEVLEMILEDSRQNSAIRGPRDDGKRRRSGLLSLFRRPKRR